jgi:hypothetical protein
VRAGQSRGPWLWPLLLVLVGIILLLDNFLLLGDFNPILLWPLLLVLMGSQILLQGDLTPGQQAQTFGITRGSVEAARLEVSAGEIDVHMRALQRAGRLIAGQFAAQSRPVMRAQDNQAELIMHRAATPWFSFANWEMGLARDLPWQVLATTHLGQVHCDLADIIVQDVMIGTGFGDIRFVCPFESLGSISLRSTLGNIQIITPHGYQVRVFAHDGAFFKVHADSTRYEKFEAGVYIARDADPEAPLVDVHVVGAFGDAYLA